MAKETIKVVCYGQDFSFASRDKALAFFLGGMAGCDPNSSEYQRYALVVSRLLEGETSVNDNYDDDDDY